MAFILTILCIALVGLIIKLIVQGYNTSSSIRTSWYTPSHQISWREYTLGVIVCALIVVPVVSLVGGKMAIGQQVSFKEWWNGYETEAIHQVINCTRNGSCQHTYSCDPHTETHTETYTDANGDVQTRTYTTTEYHSCPYTKTEHTFIIKTTLDDIIVAENWLPENPTQHYWRKPGGGGWFEDGGERIPGSLMSKSGTPGAWLAAKKRIDSGNPGGVTRQHDYDNFLLASDSTILNEYSVKITEYRKRGLIPDPARKLDDAFGATKLYDLSGQLTDKRQWRTELNRLNGALGSVRRGDLHVVVVDAEKIANPTEYRIALMASWSDKQRKPYAISKNAIVVIVGIQDESVEWVEAATGMPVGNDAMIEELKRALRGVDVTVADVLGTTRITHRSGKKPLVEAAGGIAQIILDTEPFVRVSMSGDGTAAGYAYLKDELRPTTGQRVGIAVIAILLSIPIWIAFIVLDETAISWLRDRRSDEN